MAKDNESFLKQYLLTASFHGFRYIAEPDRHWIERIFWVICCSLSWWVTGILITSAWMSNQNSATTFMVETSYSNWKTEFPSISVCETSNDDKIFDVNTRIYGDAHDFTLDELTKELVFYSGDHFYSSEICGQYQQQIDEICYKRNFGNFSQARSTCKELFRTCTWNSIDFDCCTFFQVINTDSGLCYAVNSQQTGIKNSTYKMTSSKKTGPGKLRLELNGFNKVFILGPLEVPSFTSSNIEYVTAEPHVHVKRTFTIKDIENHPEVLDLSIYQRKCRFAEENYLDVYPYYGYSACLMQCRKDAQMRKCGCAHHLLPKTPVEKQCNFTGLACISTYYEELMVQKSPLSKKTGLVCDCMPSCTEIHLSTITEVKYGIAAEYSIVELQLDRLPTERYKRNVLNGKLDLAVSVGSATALFLGASYQSFMEIFFYFVLFPIIGFFRRPRKENGLAGFYQK